MNRNRKNVEKKRVENIGFNTALLEGFLLMLVLSGLIGLPFIKLRATFELFKISFFVGLLLIGLIWFIILRSKIKWTWNGFFFILFLLLIGNLWIYLPDIREDMTLETIRTTLATNTLYQYNPATGQLLTLGIYPISKLITLPFVYSAWIDVTGVDAKIFLYYIVPIGILIMQFIVVGKWGESLFEENREKKNLFFVFYAITLLFGDYMPFAFSYRIMHMGWRGDTIVMGICIPYLILCCVELLKHGIRTRYVISVLLCLLAGIFVAPLPISVGLQGLVLVVFCLMFMVRRNNIARINTTI